MTTIQDRTTKLCQDLLSDYNRAICELAAADRHLKVIFKALFDGGMVKHLIQTGFTPAMHQRAYQTYRGLLTNLEEEQEHTPCPIDQQPSETTCPPSAPRSSAGKSPST